jgi:hypothetical protein
VCSLKNRFSWLFNLDGLAEFSCSTMWHIYSNWFEHESFRVKLNLLHLPLSSAVLQFSVMRLTTAQTNAVEQRTGALGT